ncbi:MAG TPA: class I SAM-dependent methyltransferase [Acidimicrobiales bacterium]|jgi:SAM-dependent methyltransferase|nr:class I SAM-dependent methyltransferase [Acidimicrobiales bacterium]
MWEEPATRSFLASVVDHLGEDGGLRVFDVGCGTGDGLSLLLSMPGSQRWALDRSGFQYVGIDLDDDLLDAARRVHRAGYNARFLHADIRTGIPTDPYDLYLSCGVPYSHLTPSELEETLVKIFAAARKNPSPAAVVIDVLGRYSIEWVPQWAHQRWAYSMSFFSTDKEATATDMTFYDSESLRRLMVTAADEAGCALDGTEFFDRAIMVGRHTATGHFNSGLRPYRRLVNDLMNPEVDVRYEDLLFDVELGEAPPPVLDFFREFGHRWNALVTSTRDLAASMAPASGVDPASVLQPMLAHGLERLEATSQPGLGVGHSLTGVAYTVGPA